MCMSYMYMSSLHACTCIVLEAVPHPWRLPLWIGDHSTHSEDSLFWYTKRSCFLTDPIHDWPLSLNLSRPPQSSSQSGDNCGISVWTWTNYFIWVIGVLLVHIGWNPSSSFGHPWSIYNPCSQQWWWWWCACTVTVSGSSARTVLSNTSMHTERRGVSPGPFLAFQCCILKSGRARCQKSRDWYIYVHYTNVTGVRLKGEIERRWAKGQ